MALRGHEVAVERGPGGLGLTLLIAAPDAHAARGRSGAVFVASVAGAGSGSLSSSRGSQSLVNSRAPRDLHDIIKYGAAF